MFGGNRNFFSPRVNLQRQPPLMFAIIITIMAIASLANGASVRVVEEEGIALPDNSAASPSSFSTARSSSSYSRASISVSSSSSATVSSSSSATVSAVSSSASSTTTTTVRPSYGSGSTEGGAVDNGRQQQQKQQQQQKLAISDDDDDDDDGGNIIDLRTSDYVRLPGMLIIFTDRPLSVQINQYNDAETSGSTEINEVRDVVTDLVGDVVMDTDPAAVVEQLDTILDIPSNNRRQKRTPPKNCPKNQQEQKAAQAKLDAAVRVHGVAKGKLTKATNELTRLEANPATPHATLVTKRAEKKRLMDEAAQKEKLVKDARAVVTNAGNKWIAECVKRGPPFGFPKNGKK